MNVRKTKQIVCILAIFLLFVVPSRARETVPQEVAQAAMDGLSSFLKAIPATELAHYGFSSEENLSKATLGAAFRVYTITPDKILNFDPQMELSALITPTELWFFPVLYDREVRTILTVDKMNGEWQAVAIGSSGLARQLKNVADEWPESEGYEFKFIRIYQAQSDLMVLSKKGMTKIFPLESARISLKLTKIGKEEEGLHNIVDIIPKLIPVVRQNIQSSEKIEH